LLRSLTLLTLFIHLASLAATQTAYGAGFSMLRWISLFALAGFGGLNWIASGQRSLRLKSVNNRVLIYLALWGLTVVNAGEYFLFSGYRWVAHAAIVVATLVFLPGIIREKDVSKLLWALKLIVAVILVVSYFRPAPLTIFDVPNMYRGILGNANALGHMSAVGCLLFLHGYFTQKGRLLGQLQAAMAGLAGILLIYSGARSSLVAFVGGFLVFYVFYKSRLSRYVVLGIVGVVVALVISPELSERISTFVIKHQEIKIDSITDRILFSRSSSWESHWEGFNDRPLLGWGFGVDKDSNLSGWTGDWTALGVVGRDPVNDIMYSLESGGIVGLFAYLFMLSLIFKAWIPRTLRSMFDTELRQPGYELLASTYEAWKVFYSLTVLLIVMFELDNTALAAGNFFAALFWVSLSLSMWLCAMLMSSLRRPAPIPSSLRSHIALLPAG
jgi:O-antigen ligase